MKYYVASMSYGEVDSIKEFESPDEARRVYKRIISSRNTHSSSLCESISLNDFVEGEWRLLLCKNFIPEFGLPRAFYQACDGYTKRELTKLHKELKNKTVDNEVIICKVIDSTDYF
jgi:hypothetical protein